jgi:hypothetical protein
VTSATLPSSSCTTSPSRVLRESRWIGRLAHPLREGEGRRLEGPSQDVQAQSRGNRSGGVGGTVYAYVRARGPGSPGHPRHPDHFRSRFGRGRPEGSARSRGAPDELRRAARRLPGVHRRRDRRRASPQLPGGAPAPVLHPREREASGARGSRDELAGRPPRAGDAIGGRPGDLRADRRVPVRGPGSRSR